VNFRFAVPRVSFFLLSYLLTVEGLNITDHFFVTCWIWSLMSFCFIVRIRQQF